MSLIFHPAYLQFSPCYTRSCPFIPFRPFSPFASYSFFHYLCGRILFIQNNYDYEKNLLFYDDDNYCACLQ